MHGFDCGSAVFVLLVALAVSSGPHSARVDRRTCLAPDGVRIVYSAAGAGEIALVFVHGGMADRTFYDDQLAAFADRYRVVALDLAGHGESGQDRKKWGIAEFGADVKAVADAEGLKRVVLFGNSLGGPVAIEAALLMPGRVLGVVGIDTFQDVGHPETPEYTREEGDWVRQRARMFAADYPTAMKQMVSMLFHKDADPALVGATERRMLATPQATAVAMFRGMAGYDVNVSARKLAVPLRAINGDLYPTNVDAARKVKADFEVVVLKHTGHYPMLERPAEFNAHVETVVRALTK